MRQEIDRLREELSSAKSEAPHGAEIYAGGDDEFEVEVIYRDQQWGEHIQKAAVAWDTIFFEVGPTLMEEANENQMKSRLGSEIWRYYAEKFPANLRSTRITDDSFDTIKIQLLALGLIQKSQKRHVPSDTNRYWSLTSYGETMLMKLRAIRRSGAVGPAKSTEEIEDTDDNLVEENTAD